MTLKEVVARIDEYDQKQTIYAAEPWTQNSVAIVDYEVENGGPPTRAVKAQLAYFLEIDIVQRVIYDWIMSLGREPSKLELCQRIIDYATNDA
jgi:hypothetical protein